MKDLPLFNDSAACVEPEDVDAGIVVVPRPGLAAVQHDVIILGDCTDKLDALARMLDGHSLE